MIPSQSLSYILVKHYHIQNVRFWQSNPYTAQNPWGRNSSRDKPKSSRPKPNQIQSLHISPNPEPQKKISTHEPKNSKHNAKQSIEILKKISVQQAEKGIVEDMIQCLTE